MKDFVWIVLKRLWGMRGRIRAESVLWRKYKSPEYQALLQAGAIPHTHAGSIASFIKDAAIAARCPEVVGMAELVLIEVRSVEGANPDVDMDPDGDPPRTPKEIANLGPMRAEFWQHHYEREVAEDALWEQIEWIATSQICERLTQRWFSTTQIFGLLTEMGYVRGLPRNYELTEKADGIGKRRGDPGKPGRIYWRKQMFDIVQGEIDRRCAAGGRVTLPHPRDVEA
jgi:hypothetical protein